jgi:hypothetical protein
MSYLESGFEGTRDVDAIINARAQAQAEKVGTQSYKGPKPIVYDDEFTIEEQIQVEAWRTAVAIDRAVGKLPQKFPFEGVMPTRAEGLDEMIKRFGSSPVEGNQNTVDGITVYEA